jgi:hypothetical protein
MDPSWGIDAERIAHLSQITDFDPKRHSFVSHFALELAAPCIQTLKEQGTVIFTWTIRSPEAEAIARQTVDNITFEKLFSRASLNFEAQRSLHDHGRKADEQSRHFG